MRASSGIEGGGVRLSTGRLTLRAAAARRGALAASDTVLRDQQSTAGMTQFGRTAIAAP